MTSENCPKFLKCDAPICPLDADWEMRAFIDGDPTCFYLTQSVKKDAEAVFRGGGQGELYSEMVRSLPANNIAAPAYQKGLRKGKAERFPYDKNTTKGD